MAFPADGTAAALDRSGFWIELGRTRLDRLEWPVCGLIGVGIPRMVQLETGAERPSHGKVTPFRGALATVILAASAASWATNCAARC